MLGRTIGNRNKGRRGLGYAFLHHAVDDCSRLAYSEILSDERKQAAAQWASAEIDRSDTALAAIYPDRLHNYDHHRPHAGIGGLFPAERVHNLTANYT